MATISQQRILVDPVGAVQLRRVPVEPIDWLSLLGAAHVRFAGVAGDLDPDLSSIEVDSIVRAAADQAYLAAAQLNGMVPAETASRVPLVVRLRELASAQSELLRVIDETVPPADDAFALAGLQASVDAVHTLADALELVVSPPDLPSPRSSRHSRPDTR